VPPAIHVAGVPTVGAVFTRLPFVHVCTASVVDSPARNLILTAAHCLAGAASDLSFVPAYDRGRAPYGTWRGERAWLPPAWTARHDPDLDVAFVSLRPRTVGGRAVQIEDVVGANRLLPDQGFGRRVRVTGYVLGLLDQPVTCASLAVEKTAHQAEFDCGGFAPGTSGSPWLLDPRPPMGGQVVGVIGGLEEGGSRCWVSYSPYFGADVARFYADVLRDD
jgi:V8-like Glu-specific endopeptidase